MKEKQIILAYPRGFCAGVHRACDIAHAALKKYDPPVYCRNELVHNRQVIAGLESKGMVFVKRVDEVPVDSVLLFSAHGVSPEVRAEAHARGLRVIDATCPFVDKVHREVRRYAREGRTVFLVGKRHHDEIIGVSGEAPDSVIVVETIDEAQHVRVPDPRRVAVVTQTTLSVDETGKVIDALRKRFPKLSTPSRGDICYATTNRQDAVRAIATDADYVLVLGSRSSSNSKRLVEVAQAVGTTAALVEEANELQAFDLTEVATLGVTAGASTPQSLIDDVIEALRGKGFTDCHEHRVAEESFAFQLPDDLQA